MQNNTYITFHVFDLHNAFRFLPQNTKDALKGGCCEFTRNDTSSSSPPDTLINYIYNVIFIYIFVANCNLLSRLTIEGFVEKTTLFHNGSCLVVTIL